MNPPLNPAPTVYVNLMGGLGNQLHQYLFAKNLEQQLGRPIDQFCGDFSNDAFGRELIVPHFTDSDFHFTDISQITQGVIVNSEAIQPMVEYINSHPNQTLVLKGYWQDLVYLEAIDIAKHLAIPSHTTELFALHVRRHDYGHHGHLPLSYYTDALEQAGCPPFVVYTDEPNFSRHLFGKLKGYQGVVLPNLARPDHDFKLLLNHKHFVIGNSSYSRLAAYLSYAVNRGTVFYPSQWNLFGDESPGFPDGWIPIPTRLISPL